MKSWTVERISELTEWESYRAAWQTLAGHNPMLQWDWYRAWWSGFGVERQLCILVAKEKGEPKAFLPLAFSSFAVFGRSLNLIGSDRACSDGQTIIAKPQDQSIAAQLFVEWLANAQGSHGWDHLELDGIRPSDLAWQAFRAECELRGVPLCERTSDYCWHIDLPADEASYLQGLSKRARKLLRDLDQSLIQSHRAKQHIANSISSARDMLAAIEKLHTLRRQEKGDAGCFGRVEFQRMMQALVERMWPTGQLELTSLTIDDQVVAGGIHLLSPTERSIYLVGMHPGWESYRPGFLANLLNIRRSISEGKQRLNFLRGDELYKQRLGGIPIGQERWVLAPPRNIHRIVHSIYSTRATMVEHRGEMESLSGMKCGH